MKNRKFLLLILVAVLFSSCTITLGTITVNDVTYDGKTGSITLRFDPYRAYWENDTIYLDCYGNNSEIERIELWQLVNGEYKFITKRCVYGKVLFEDRIRISFKNVDISSEDDLQLRISTDYGEYYEIEIEKCRP